MPNPLNEAALEQTIERALCGQTTEDVRAQPGGHVAAEPPVLYGAGAGFWRGQPQDVSAPLALDPVRLLHFLETTQPHELRKLEREPNWQNALLTRIANVAQTKGTLHLLRHGLKHLDADLCLFFPAPLPGSAPAVAQRFDQNEFSLTRQVHYSTKQPGQSLDMVVFLNGLPLATLELKNAITGQTARKDGQDQYKFSRDATQPLLQFGRCLVHFAVDTDEVYMTTRLAGAATTFLPFNRGHNFGAGNPPTPTGYKTSYLWQEVLTRPGVAALVQHYVTLTGKATDPLTKRRLIFPRYHQLEVVKRLLADVSVQGVGQTYLIQHSAGSGKSNSIVWTAFRLLEAYAAHALVPGSRDLTTPLFDSVVLVTDRRVLDRQISDNVQQFAQSKSIVAHAESGQDLKTHLESGKRIIITTVQKFPVIVEKIADLGEQRFAVIIDEAHSSQSGTAHDSMNRAMGRPDTDDEDVAPDPQDLILAAMQSRKMRGNASYFAFTATPKNTTLEKFGQKQPDGTFRPFHLYSMKQAIEEGFILDVLANYTTYRSYYEVIKSVEDNPLFDTARAQRKLKAYVERHPDTIQTKAGLMLEHFTAQVVSAKKLHGRAKGMVITQDIASAIRYFLALRGLVQQQNAPWHVAVAFSGKKTVDGIEYTEDGLNGFSAADLPARFDTDDYRLLVVANKYLTGFDQPKLSVMYVDKRLQGVLAVQALSRLNRAAPELGKRTEDLFVLDFFNDTADIRAAFDPFYTATLLTEATDVNVLHELKEQLDSSGLYDWPDVVAFTTAFFAGEKGDALIGRLNVAKAQFDTELGLDDAGKADLKIKAKQFVKVYGQVAAILPFSMVAWEQLYWFLKFLIPLMVVRDPQADLIDELLETVDLSTYGVERTALNVAIGLDAAEGELDPQNPAPRAAHGADSQHDPLDDIIRAFNERYFQGWEATPEEQRVKFISIVQQVRQRPDFAAKVAQNTDAQTRELALMVMIDDAINQKRRQELDLYKRYAQDPAFKQGFRDSIRRMLGL